LILAISCGAGYENQRYDEDWALYGQHARSN
jgi:hypothetical protein